MSTDFREERHAQMRAWLEKMRLSGAAFAAAVGVSYTTAAKWIYEGRPPRAQSRAKIAEVFPDCPALAW